ncbi:MAG: S8 family serine peptidase [Rhodothermales bacterium]|nr:S8 family serine peptidase [Rhodothermales bacterium]MBO6778709.1 S8 family serine peptidase [Rhodothermales bacterium]
MRVLLLLLAAILTAPAVFAQGVERSFLIKLTPEADRALRISTTKAGVRTGIPSLDSLHREFGAAEMVRVFPDAGRHEARHRAFGLHRWYKLRVKEVDVSEALLDRYRSSLSVERVDRVRKRSMRGGSSGAPLRPDATPRPGRSETPLRRGTEIRATTGAAAARTPDDPSFSAQWQYNAANDADIDLVEAWDLTTGSPDVIVAVLDSGADLDHPDLVNNLWTNPGEIAGNGIDDDNNGFVDDIHGWDFSDGDNSPQDVDGHGTHTAGTIAASTNNGVGVAGVAGGFDGGGARVMPLKIFENALDDLIANAFVYAADNGAVIASNSWGGGDQSSLIEDAINYFNQNAGGQGQPMVGGLVVFASGNDGSNDPSWGYPASLPSVMGVAASDQGDRIPNWSNYGSYVDISAPGAGILSTVVNGYDTYDGTSMACPHVAGVAALVASYAPGMTAAQVRSILEQSADNIDSLNPSRVGQLGAGRLNAAAALALAVPPAPDHEAPGAIAALSVSGATSGSLALTWTATGDDGSTGRAHHYDIRYATTPIGDFEAAASAVGPTPANAGQQEAWSLTGLQSSTTYYVALRAVDEAGNKGPVSAQVSGTTADGPSLVAQPTSLSASVEAGGTTSLELNLQNTGSASLTFTAAVVPPSTNARRDVLRRDKEHLRRQVRALRDVTLRSGGSVLVWDPSGVGADLPNDLAALGHQTDYVTSLGAAGDLGSYQMVLVTLGSFPYNHVLTRGQANTLSNYLDGGGALYMEGGDTWAYDTPRSVHDYFGAVGVDDGTNDLDRISGVSGTWAAGADWTYTTDPDLADFVDHLEPVNGGEPVLTNTPGGYHVAVALDAGSYRTLAASFAAAHLGDADRAEFLSGAVNFLTGGAGGPAPGPWIAVSSESGSLAAGAAATLTVSIDAATLAEGTHQAVIAISADGGALRVDVPVTLTVTGGGTTPSPDPTPDPTPDPVLQFEATDLVDLDGDTLDLWPDATGNGHDAAQGSGGRQPWVLTGWIGDAPAVVFDGHNDYLRLSNHQDINLGGPYAAKTVAMVFETGPDTQAREVIFEEGGASRGLAVYQDQGQVHLSAWNLPADGGAGNWGPVTVSGSVEHYTLYTVVLTLDGENGTLSGRLNGTSLGSVAGAGQLFAHSGRVGLGAMWNATRFHDGPSSGTGHYFSGSIAGMRYFNEALTESQAAAVEGEFRDDYFGGLSSLTRKRPATVEPEALPAAFTLDQNYPNPFNPTTSIAFTLSEGSAVRLEIFDALGRRVRTLSSGQLPAGAHSVTWDARDASGRHVASGTYLYRLEVGGQVQTRTMLLLK